MWKNRAEVRDPCTPWVESQSKLCIEARAKLQGTCAASMTHAKAVVVPDTNGLDWLSSYADSKRLMPVLYLKH